MQKKIFKNYLTKRTVIDIITVSTVTNKITDKIKRRWEGM